MYHYIENRKSDKKINIGYCILRLGLPFILGKEGNQKEEMDRK